MSALDQALIKAYDKPARSPAATAVPPPAGSSAAAPALASGNAAAIERIYHEGGLYRIDLGGQRAAQDRASQVRQDEIALGGPHFELLPPTSPKRGVRRSILRLLASQATLASAAELDPPEPPPVRRKVIIRHVSHGGPIPPHHWASPIAPEGGSSTAEDPASGSPTTLFELNSLAPAIEVHGHWDAAASAAQALVLIPDSLDPRTSVKQALVHVQLDALLEPEFVSTAESEPAEEVFSAKSLDDEHPTQIRADQAHAPGPRRPHLSFGNAKPAQQPVAAIPADEFTLADDVQLSSPVAAAEPSAAPAPHTVPPAAPVWEVDHFHWPRTCEKLLADESGYLASAGNKLLAAVRDGLKTLAITGSRRGEGRTTLALCLARVAARAGIQVALLDADFARPSLASKLGLDVSHGWQDAAFGTIPLSEAAVKSLAENITVLPLEITSARRALSLADPRVTATLRAAVATFELVIVDLGPLGPGEAVAFPPGEKCPFDATIVVRDLRFSSAAESNDVGERLYDAGVEGVGVAENFVVVDEE
jgi:Mrp family chromosome partitioning ATPase